MTQPPPPPGYPPPAGQAPNNHLALSIIALLFCLIPGIVAIVKSSQVSGLWAQGKYAQAQASADGAKTWAIWSIVLGAVFGVIYAILMAGALNADHSNAAMFAAMF
ncbi:MAG TPA: CD225/dispanin family protein [Mycobacterium sp.]|nr:CD225/dispanin family protein [Mycobacterium sp.]HUH69404.1 CD225/dispanin family protein [Mycobacterium sp.]